MIITSKYDFTCTKCQGKGKAGQRVEWTRGVYGVRHVGCSEEGKNLQRKLDASRAATSEHAFPAPEGKTYLPFQRAGIAYAIERECALIADEMGLGKTIQAIGVINATNVRTVTIVCPASLKLNWCKELDAWVEKGFDWYPEKGFYLGACRSRDLVVRVINYDNLKKLTPEDIDLIIFDEFHYCKNQTALRTKHAHALASKAKRVLGLTGTPIENKPVELFSLLQILRHPLGKKFTTFAYRYCAPKQVWTGKRYVTDFTGSSHAEELQERLRADLMVRRLKSDVLTELPAKTRMIVPFPGKHDKYASLADELTEGNFDDVVKDLQRGAKVAFEEISATRHAQALEKVPHVIAFVKNACESGKKIILFAHHRNVIEELEKGLVGNGITCVAVTGETDGTARYDAVHRFQTDPSLQVFIGSIQATGVGLTLTAASHVIFAELDWRPGMMQQAEDRAHRIGQTDNVLVQYLVTDGTLDAKIAKILAKKVDVISRTLDVESEKGTLSGMKIDESEILFGIGGKILAKTVEPAFTEDKCICLAPPDSDEHMVWCDRTKEAPKPVFVEKNKVLSDEQIKAIHNALKKLANVCDGAHTEDGCGFNKYDSAFGKKLASCEKLTEKQALAAQRMLKKYRRQIGDV